ncbi:peptidase S8 [Streptomyces sp. NPDC087270]|uniref:S53 family peptidase n=1 Tax=Streptomyces sp. NPDC087270 TaxID=3365774 RepID=UPI0038300850
MRHLHARYGRTLLVSLAALATAVLPVGAASAHARAAGASADRPAASAAAPVRQVCGPAGPGQARCLAQIRTDVHTGTGVRGPAAHASAGSAAAALPPGYGPADLRDAYQLPSTGGADQTVAVVDAGGDPSAEADLAVYRSTYGLPPCTVANGCLSILNQRGQTSPLPADLRWSVEISLDLDAASAACPACHVMLVEGDDAGIPSLAAAVDTAVTAGATEVSNSYGATEQNGMQPYAASYSHPGVAILASSGDSGYGIPNTPAVYPTVIAAGGTTLTRAPGTARGWTESAWQGAGSGCSAWVDKPAWQHDANCPGRMVADISSVADPNPGLAVYDTDNKTGGWVVVGGTSAASPFLAGAIAVAGNPAAFPDASSFYTATTGLNDVTTGSNVTSTDCGGDYQCTAGPGYDGPTGNGTPLGTAAL